MKKLLLQYYNDNDKQQQLWSFVPDRGAAVFAGDAVLFADRFFAAALGRFDGRGRVAEGAGGLKIDPSRAERGTSARRRRRPRRCFHNNNIILFNTG